MLFLASLNKDTYLKAMEGPVLGYIHLYFVRSLQIPLTVINVSVPRAGAMSEPPLQPRYSTWQRAWHSQPELNSAELKKDNRVIDLSK